MYSFHLELVRCIGLFSDGVAKLTSTFSRSQNADKGSVVSLVCLQIIGVEETVRGWEIFVRQEITGPLNNKCGTLLQGKLTKFGKI